MRYKVLITMLLIAAIAFGCQHTRPMTINPCPLPQGFDLVAAIETAEKSLTRCPELLDDTFMALLQIAKHKPTLKNRLKILDMLKRLSNQNLISQRYAKDLYNRYFDFRFISLPDIKLYNLRGEIDNLKQILRAELRMKKTGLVECCGDMEGYGRAEAEFARVVNLMENLILNAEYLQGRDKNNW